MFEHLYYMHVMFDKMNVTQLFIKSFFKVEDAIERKITTQLKNCIPL